MPRSYKAVTLSTIYPKRTFTDADMSQTLLDLELAPSAILVVVPAVSTSLLLTSDHGLQKHEVGGRLIPLFQVE